MCMCVVDVEYVQGFDACRDVSPQPLLPPALAIPLLLVSACSLHLLFLPFRESTCFLPLAAPDAEDTPATDVSLDNGDSEVESAHPGPGFDTRRICDDMSSSF